jgi:hypothetical protein
MSVQVGAVYRHYKGNHYRIIALAKDCDTLEDLVVYRCLYDNPTSQIWTRKLASFIEVFMLEGKLISRFERV